MPRHDLGNESDDSGKSVWYPSRDGPISNRPSPTMPQTCSLTPMRHQSGVPSFPKVYKISGLGFEQGGPLGQRLTAFIQRIAATVAQSTVDSMWSASSASFTSYSPSVLLATNAIPSFRKSNHPSHGWGRRFNPCRAHHLKPWF